MFGKLEKYRKYLNAEKTLFKDLMGITVHKNNKISSGWAYRNWNGDRIEYTYDKEFDSYARYRESLREIREKKEKEANKRDWSETKKKYMSLPTERYYEYVGTDQNIEHHVLPGSVTVDIGSFENYTVGPPNERGFAEIDKQRSKILDYIKAQYPELVNIDYWYVDKSDKYGVGLVFGANLNTDEDNPNCPESVYEKKI